MQGLTEKLELMQWLYGQGIANKVWYREYDGGEYWFTGSELMTEEAKPWYPLEQVLELLPKNTSKNFEFYLNLSAITPNMGYRDNYDTYPIVLIEDDYHLAALKLLKQVLSEGKDE